LRAVFQQSNGAKHRVGKACLPAKLSRLGKIRFIFASGKAPHGNVG